MAKDTNSVTEPATPAQHLQYPDGDYSSDDVKPFDIFLWSDGYVVRVPEFSRMMGGYMGKPRRSIPSAR